MITRIGHEKPNGCWITILSVVELEGERPRIGIGIGKYPGTCDIDTIVMWNEEYERRTKGPEDVFKYELMPVHGCISIPGDLMLTLTGEA